MSKKKYILIQARLSSRRFPGKMLKNLNGIPLIQYVYNRCQQTDNISGTIVLTSIEKSDDELYTFCLDNDIPVFRGDLDNVLKRYLDAAQKYEIDMICRVCGDSPFVDIEAIDKMFSLIENNDIEYSYPTNILNGFMSEVFTLDLLQKVYNFELTIDDKEHVTKYIRDNIGCFKTQELDLSLKDKTIEEYSLTIDYPSDLDIAQEIAEKLDSFNFKSENIINFLKSRKN